MSRYKAFSFGELPDFADPKEYCDEYEHLFDMVEKKHICSLTEPEDRTFYRDLDPLLQLLDEMSATTHNSDYAVTLTDSPKLPSADEIFDASFHCTDTVHIQKILDIIKSLGNFAQS